MQSSDMPKTANTIKQNPGHWFKPGKSGNPSGRPKGVAAAALKIQEEAAKLADKPHPRAKELSTKYGFPVRTILQGVLIQLVMENPDMYLSRLGGKALQNIDISGGSTPAVVNVQFINSADDNQPATTA